MSRPLVHVYLDNSKTKAAGGQPLYAGISGAAALKELEKANGPGNLKDPAGVVVSSDDQNLPEGDYLFIPAGVRTPWLMLPGWVPRWIQSLVDLVMPTVPAMHLPGFEELARRQKLIEQRFDHPVVSPEARQLAEKCSFLIFVDEPVLASTSKRKRTEKQVLSGMGFFYGPKSALSCAHTLPEASLQKGAVVKAMEKDATSPIGICEIMLTVRDFDVEMDWVQLTVSSEHSFMPTFSGAPTELVGAPLGLCSFHLSLHKELGEPLSSLGIMPGQGIHVSHNARHILYDCPCWPGDSGAAVLLYKGQIAAMHQEGVNSVRELIRQGEDTKPARNARLDALAESLQSVIDSTSQGALALIATHFPSA